MVILGLLVCCFFRIEYVKMCNPHRSADIERAFVNGRIQFPVYGDDHVPGVGKEIADVVNEKGFAQFVSKFFFMEIRNI